MLGRVIFAVACVSKVIFKGKFVAYQKQKISIHFHRWKVILETVITKQHDEMLTGFRGLLRARG